MRFLAAVGLILGVAVTPLISQQEPSAAEPARAVLQQPAEAPEHSVAVPRGTRVPLVLLNSVSSKHASPGDRVYLESIYPVVIDGRILIPTGTYVSGSVMSVKRTGRVKGRGEIFLRFEQMILPNGTIRDLTGRVGALDGSSPEDLDREEGKISAESSKGGDTRTVAETTAAGASIGVIAGAAGGRTGLGAGVGAAAGAAAGLIGVLASRGPEAILEKGTQLDMVLDRELHFTDQELTFDDALGRAGGRINPGPGPDPNRNRNSGRSGRLSPF